MPNRLAAESSPYLLQHANNPVDWHPWGAEALSQAQSLDKPIFLSIGYAACHWCHVMEHESFENRAIAQLMNENFICIKVDREERPDLDQIYMSAVQAMTGRGGWPMSVFLTPRGEPFYGGTYWPPAPRLGMPGFSQVLKAVAEAWMQRREQAESQATALTEHVRDIAARELPRLPLSVDMIANAAAGLASAFDETHGGFGGAPKFPHPMDLRVLLRAWHRTTNNSYLHCVTHTLEKMASGGIYDRLGGGFHRYSVDERWLVPHFEKMLYDNALLVPCYLEAFQATGNTDFARVARETCEYVLREMTDPRGGFFSTQDADSEGEEGKYFVWTRQEIETELGAQSHSFCVAYDVTEHGNFEGANILNMPRALASCAAELHLSIDELQKSLSESRAKLFAARESRVKPGLDDKVIVAWNGLMIDALTLASGVLNEPRYLQAAERAADFLLAELCDSQGRLLHVWRQGTAKLDAYLDDYAALANGLVSLFEISGKAKYLQVAVQLTEKMTALFHDPQGGGFFYTAHDHEQLIARTKDLTDNATPGGNSLAATLLARLGYILGEQAYLDLAEATVDSASAILAQSPAAAGQMLIAYDLLAGPTEEWVFVNFEPEEQWQLALTAAQARFLPHKVLVPISKSLDAPPCLAKRLESLPDQTDSMLLRCEGFACRQPVLGMQNVLLALRGNALRAE